MQAQPTTCKSFHWLTTPRYGRKQVQICSHWAQQQPWPAMQRMCSQLVTICSHCICSTFAVAGLKDKLIAHCAHILSNGLRFFLKKIHMLYQTSSHHRCKQQRNDPHLSARNDGKRSRRCRWILGYAGLCAELVAFLFHI